MQLFLDCDGVLADFDSHFKMLFGETPQAFEETHGAQVFWDTIRYGTEAFYRDLPLMSDARILMDSVSHFRPIILTGCPYGGWAETQKMEWAETHFPGVPLVACKSSKKALYCRPGDIIIDDRPHYKPFWEDALGTWIVHHSARESVEELTAILLERGCK